ncbi:MAG: hypothetical protein AAFP19_17365 [Bacteroidota bacterium]
MGKFKENNSTFINAVDWVKFNKDLNYKELNDILGFSTGGLYNLIAGRMEVKEAMKQKLIEEFPETERFFEPQPPRVDYKALYQTKLYEAMEKIIEVQERERDLLIENDQLRKQIQELKKRLGIAES